MAYKLIISEKNKKRDIRDWYQQQSGSDRYRDQPDGNNDIYRRGDIPVLHGDCDGKCIEVAGIAHDGLASLVCGARWDAVALNL